MPGRAVGRRAPFALLVLALLPLAQAGADDCYSTSNPDFDTGGTPAGQFYANQDCAFFMENCIFVVVYQESNGLPGLQRQDYLRDNVKHCRDQGFAVQPDTLLFENPDSPV